MRKILTLLSLFFCNTILGQTLPLDSLKNALKVLIEKPNTVQRDSLMTVTIYSICTSISLAEPEVRQSWTDSLINFSKKSKWKQSAAYSHLASGRNFHFNGYTKLSMQEMEMAIKLFKKFENDKMYSIAFMSLAVGITNYIFINPIADEATEKKYFNYLSDALEIAKKQENPSQIANMNLSLMQYYFKHKKYEEAKETAINTWEIAKNDIEKYFYYYFGGKWSEGLNLLYLNKEKDGFKLINEVKKVCQKTRKDGYEKYLVSAIGMYLGNYYLEKKDYPNAIIEAKMGEIALKSMKIPNFDYKINKIFYQAYKNTNNPKEALLYFEKMQAFEQDQQNKETMGQYLNWQLKYEDEKQTNKIQKLENQKLTQIKNFLSIIGILGLAMTIYVFFINRKLRKKNIEIQKALLDGQTMERKRMASELHDNISNKILGVKMRVEMLENDSFSIKEKYIYDSTIRFIDEVYADIRLVSHNLLPEELEKNGLSAAVESLIKKVNLIDKTQFDSQIQLRQIRFLPRLEYEIYTIIFELVNNILKHAHAQNAMISISDIDCVLKINVADNGKGFDNQIVDPNGLGLKNINSRVLSFGGSIAFVNNEGTAVEIKIPF